MSETGALVYVMGPSGAGKDFVLDRARALLPAGTAAVFAHRYITRPADTGGENHVALSLPEFELRRSHGLFAFEWEAHGNRYALGVEIDLWRRRGLSVVVSGSREHFNRASGIDANTWPVLITAPAERLAQRLATRGREDSVAANARLARSTDYVVDDSRLLTIVNDGPLDRAASAFLNLLATLETPRAVRRQA